MSYECSRCSQRKVFRKKWTEEKIVSNERGSNECCLKDSSSKKFNVWKGSQYCKETLFWKKADCKEQDEISLMVKIVRGLMKEDFSPWKGWMKQLKKVKLTLV